MDLAVMNSDPKIAVHEAVVALGQLNGAIWSMRSTVRTRAGTGRINRAVSGDFDNDGILDLAITLDSTGELGIMIGIGNGAFRPLKTVAAVPPANLPSNSIVAGDFKTDGALDILLVAGTGATMSLLTGGGPLSR
jgi:hypothetical protein